MSNQLDKARKEIAEDVIGYVVRTEDDEDCLFDTYWELPEKQDCLDRAKADFTYARQYETAGGEDTVCGFNFQFAYKGHPVNSWQWYLHDIENNLVLSGRGLSAGEYCKTTIVTLVRMLRNGDTEIVKQVENAIQRIIDVTPHRRNCYK